MVDFSLLDELASLAQREKMPVYRIAMYYNDEIREREVIPANIVNCIYSVSKNFITTAAGMCIDDGLLRYDTTVWELFHEDYPDMNPLWKEVTAERAMSQTVGIGGMFLDIDCQNAFSWGDDWLKAVLDQPFVTKPGEAFAYSDSNFYLVSRMVAKVTGRPAQELLQKRLFGPLKMQGWAWSTCPDGHAVGGSGLYCRTADLAKLGAVYLNGGELFGVRVVSEEFVRHATTPISKRNSDTGYGLSFWLPKNDPHGVIRGSGMLGQVIWIDPEDRFVLAWHAVDPEGEVNLNPAIYARR